MVIVSAFDLLCSFVDIRYVFQIQFTVIIVGKNYFNNDLPKKRTYTLYITCNIWYRSVLTKNATDAEYTLGGHRRPS